MLCEEDEILVKVGELLELEFESKLQYYVAKIWHGVDDFESINYGETGIVVRDLLANVVIEIQGVLARWQSGLCF